MSPTKLRLIILKAQSRILVMQSILLQLDPNNAPNRASGSTTFTFTAAHMYQGYILTAPLMIYPASGMAVFNPVVCLFLA